MMSDQMRSLSHQLRLFGVHANFEKRAAQAAGQGLTHLEFLRLILDDFGLRNYTHDEANVLVDLLEDRHRKGSVILTSQADPKGWPKLFEDPLIAEAIVSRLEHPSQKLILRGGNYREKLQSQLPAGNCIDKETMLN